MSTREDLDQFLTDEGRALVDQFAAEAPAAGDDDVDMDEVIQQNLADHEAALTGKPKSARPNPPVQFVGYVVMDADYTPPKRTKTSWVFGVPPLYYGPADALAEVGGDVKAVRGDVPKALFEVTVTFKQIEDGGKS